MKTKLAIIALLLSGCATQYTARLYDPVEYNHAITISVAASHAISRCSVQDNEFKAYMNIVNGNSYVLTEYVANKDDSAQVLPAALQVRSLTDEMAKRSSYSPRYCQHKLTDIQISARMFARGVGNTDRFNICQGGVAERIKLFEQSYASGQITKEEYADLINDILKLQAVDTAGCTLEQRKQIEQAITVAKSALSLIM